MTINDIKEYVVIVNGGSGCIFQPKTDDYTYVLTAKHIFDDIDSAKYNGNIIITMFQLENDEWKEVEKVYPLKKGSCYFPHPTKDLAIIKIPKMNGLENLVRIDDIEQDRQGYTLAGYPSSRRGKDQSPSQWFRSNEDTVITIKRDYGLREAKVEDNPDIEEIRGQSGGGILKIYDDFILLAGIQNKMVDGSEQLGYIEFSPISNFDEIIETYKDKLSPILPIYSKEKIWLKKYAQKKQSQFLSADVEKKNIELLIKEKVTTNGLDKNVNSANEKSEYVKGRLSDFVFNNLGLSNKDQSENGQHKWLLLGEGGSGKSTSLLKLASDALSIALMDDKAPIPIYIKLNSFNFEEGDMDGLFSHISNEIEEPDTMKFKKWYYDSDRTFLFLFDGFNEVENQKACKKILEIFLEKKSHYYIISSRPGEGSKYLNQISGLRQIEVEPLDNLQIKEYLSNQGAIELYKQLDEQLKGLTRNPFMLWALVESCHNTNYELPHNIGQLYKNFIEDKIIKGRESKLELQYDKVLKVILGKLAYFMTCKNVTQVKLDNIGAELNSWLIMERDKEENQWRGGIMPDKPVAINFLNDAIQHGIIRSIVDEYEFMHQTVQEYFTAVHMSGLPLDDELLNKIPKLRSRQINIDSKDIDKEIEGPDAGWFRVPILMLSGILKQTEIDNFLVEVSARNILMAAKCFSTSTHASNDIKEKFIDSWKKLLDKKSPVLKCLGCLCFGYSKMENQELMKILVDLVKNSSEEIVRKTAAKAIGYSGEYNNIKELVDLAMSDNENSSEYTWGEILNSTNSTVVVQQLFEYFRNKQNPTYVERAQELLEELDKNKIANAFLDTTDEEISKIIEEGVRVKFKSKHENYYFSIFRILNIEKVIEKLVDLYIKPDQEDWYYENIKSFIYYFDETTLRFELKKLIGTSNEKSDKKATVVEKLLSEFSRTFVSETIIPKYRAWWDKAQEEARKEQELFHDRLKNVDFNTLVQKLNSDNVNERAIAIKLIGINKNRAAIDILLDHLRNEGPNGYAYESLMSVLSNIEDKEYVIGFFKKNVSNPLFFRATDLEDSVVKELDTKLKLIELAKHLDERVISDLIKFINPNEPSIIQNAALNSLAKFKNFDLSSNIEELLDFETNTDTDIIENCIKLLGDSKSQLAIRPLLKILNKIEFSERSFNLFDKFSLTETLLSNDPSRYWIEEISDALKKIEDQKNVWLSLIDLFGDKMNKIRHASFWLIVNVFSKQELLNSILIEALKDEEPAIRLEAIKTLFRLKHKNNVTLFLKISIEDENSEVRMAAVSALKFTENDDILPKLIKKLEEKDNDKLPNTIAALGYMMDESASEPLEKLFNETKDSQIKILVAGAINKIGNYVDATFLIECLLPMTEKSNETMLRKEAAACLLKIPGGADRLYKPIEDWFANDDFDSIIEFIGFEEVFNPDDIELFWFRGRAYHNKEQYQKALIDYKKIEEKSKNLSNYFYYYRALVYIGLNSFDEADKDAESLYNLEINNYNNYIYAAWIKFKIKKISDAIDLLHRVLKIENDNLLANFNLGLAYLANSQEDEAIKQYRQALNIYAISKEDNKEKILTEVKKDLKELIELNKDLKPSVDKVLGLLK